MTDKEQHSFLRRCVSDILNGLAGGFTRFSGPSRAAALVAPTPESPLYVCDPLRLLRGHEPIFRQLFLDNEDWRHRNLDVLRGRKFINVLPLPDPDLSGLLASGASSGPVFFQYWFTEEHPNLCSTGPSKCWLEHAIWRLTNDLASGDGNFTGISGDFLKEYATHAVRDYIKIGRAHV